MAVKKKAIQKKVTKKKISKKAVRKKTTRSQVVSRKVYLTFPRLQTKEAIICDMYDRYKVRFNVRSASVDDQMGLIALELEAPDMPTLLKAFKYFEKRGVKVEPIEISVLEP